MAHFIIYSFQVILQFTVGLVDKPMTQVRSLRDTYQTEKGIIFSIPDDREDKFLPAAIRQCKN